jgi:hypothetical protein
MAAEESIRFRTASYRRSGGSGAFEIQPEVAFLDAIMKPEFHRTYPVHDLVATDKSLLDSLIAGAKGGIRDGAVIAGVCQHVGHHTPGIGGRGENFS